MEKIYIEDIRQKLNNNFDVKYREIECDSGIIYLIYIGHLCDAKYMSEFIVTPIMTHPDLCYDIDIVKRKVISAASIDEVNSAEDAVKHILSANAVIFFSYLNRALFCEAKGFSKRAIDIPITETVIRGPREGFTESLSDNLSSIRRIIKNTNLKIEELIMGQKSNTLVALLYIDGIAPVKLVSYVRDAIINANNKSKSGFTIYSNYIEEEMQCKGTAFETVGYTEKPDIACAKLSEGSALVLVEGSPFVITTPYYFIENFQSADDYTLNKVMGNLGRILRWLAFLIATFAPAMYLALVTYHFKLVPTTYLIRMAIFRAGVPVPTVIELIYMTFFFQIIREAGVRLPQPIGPTLSIVGALILGDAAVTSGLASQVTVVVVAISSITSYLLPKMYAALFIWDLIFISFSGILGLPGFYMAFVVFVAHMANLTTCRYPYLYPLGTRGTFKYKDIMARGNLADISNKIFTKDDKK